MEECVAYIKWRGGRSFVLRPQLVNPNLRGGGGRKRKHRKGGGGGADVMARVGGGR